MMKTIFKSLDLFVQIMVIMNDIHRKYVYRLASD